MNMEWISVNDRPPKPNEKIDLWIVLKTTFSTNLCVRETDCIYDGKVFTKPLENGFWRIIKNVTHWMPSPEPPKE